MLFDSILRYEPALGTAWKYALKTAPSLCRLKEKVSSMTFPEDVSLMAGEEPGVACGPHHLGPQKKKKKWWEEIKLQEVRERTW